MLMNLALLVWGISLSLIFGFYTWLYLQIIMMGVAACSGVWLFYVQHQFEDTYWEKPATGTSLPRPWKEAVFTIYLKFFNGFLVISDFIIFIT